jgi:hypothetical protein
MPIEQHIQLDQRQLKSTRAMYAAIRGGLPRAMGDAMRPTIRKARVSIVRGIADEIAVAQSKLYARGNHRRPIVDRLVRRGGQVVGGEVTIKTGRIPLGRFKPKQSWRKGRTQGRVRTRVSYKIDKGGGRQKIADAFLLEFSSGYQGIFRREGASRLPLYQLHGPSIPEVAETNPRVKAVMDREAGETLVEETDRRIDFLLARAVRN